MSKSNIRIPSSTPTAKLHLSEAERTAGECVCKFGNNTMWTPGELQASFGSPLPAQVSRVDSPCSAQAEVEQRRKAER